MSARIKLPSDLSVLSRSELERAIYESAFHRDDDLIARRYLVEKVAQMDIAAELGWTRGTVGSHIPTILERVSDMAKRISTNHT